MLIQFISLFLFLTIYGSNSLDNIKKGAEIYLSTCQNCHELSDVKYADLFGLHQDKAGYVKSYQIMEKNINLTSVMRSRGPEYILNILQGYKKNKDNTWCKNNNLYYNHFFEGNWIMMPPFLEDIKDMKNVILFLEWAADRHRTNRYKMGIKVVFYLSVLLCFIGGILYLEYKKE